ncbi:3-phosphoshikimate 1-carboxyvinyltransferase [Porphyromonas sp. COT-108 OH1349]|uniref:3-phosphoshikimate 1-carboxyvinyltransferase n=1 Tax=Porphyromonas sp. COT-108 OH1349 TaxID=1537504 RepID=UPI00052E1DF8|nr:hypothetical protein [Porphyromonas sp. COT-108 OH1349]KGN67856.1 hypothetical protein JT26_07910 [Porphyromonas sp. COT-108 OH1349]
MQPIILSPPFSSASGQSIQLPLSKSIYNRLLIIEALGRRQDALLPLSAKALEDKGSYYPNDILVLSRAVVALVSSPSTEETILVDVEDCGSALRFVVAYAALATKRCVVISGTERLMQRPMDELLVALNRLGGEVAWEKGEDKRDRIVVRPSSLKSGKIDLTESRSSQFISALLLISPYLPDGLEVEWDASSVSKTYVYMTLSLMRRYGIECSYTDKEIKVLPGRYLPVSTRDIEADWSSALYWFAFIALSSLGAHLKLQDLTLPSLQGDASAAALFRLIGVKAERDEVSGSTTIVRVPCVEDFHTAFDGLNMHIMPDAAPTMAVVLALRGIPYRMVGLETLPLKESNRLVAVKEGLRLFGLDVELTASSILFRGGEPTLPQETLHLNSHNDHRIAMSFAVASAMGYEIAVDDPSVVNKSYPLFWRELQQVLNPEEKSE